MAFELKRTFPVSAADLYQAWLTSLTHSQMTGGEAVCSKEIGGTFSAWDGYISGRNLELEKDQKIVQAWRTSEFDDADDSSILTLEFTDVPGGAELHLQHSHLPENMPDFEQGWIEYYFEPMEDFFGTMH